MSEHFQEPGRFDGASGSTNCHKGARGDCSSLRPSLDEGNTCTTSWGGGGVERKGYPPRSEIHCTNAMLPLDRTGCLNRCRIHATHSSPRSELEAVEPKGYQPEPSDFLPSLRDPRLRAWALALHRLWPALHRRMKDDVRQRPECHSMVYLPHPFFIPGAVYLLNISPNVLVSVRYSGSTKAAAVHCLLQRSDEFSPALINTCSRF